MVLKKICKKVLEDVFVSTKEQRKWKILVVDDLTMSILNSCFSTVEILRQNIVSIESLFKKREPFSCFEAIYIIYPTSKAIGIVISDFQQAQCMYMCAHIFFLYAVSNELFNILGESRSAAHFRTIKEIYIAFEPVESQIFHVSETESLQKVYVSSIERVFKHCHQTAEKIATLCCTLEEYPLIRYSRRHVSNSVMADCIKQKLDILTQSFPLKTHREGGRSHLLILDRGFDCISPLLHELTLQALVHDVLPVVNRTLEFEHEPGKRNLQNINLDDTDNFWVENCHKHIVNFSHDLEEIMKEFDIDSDTIMSTEVLRRMSRDMSKVLLLQQKKKYSSYKHMAALCYAILTTEMRNLCKLEQALALRINFSGEALKDPSKDVISLLKSKCLPTFCKLRLLILFIFYKNGMSESALESIFDATNFSVTEKRIISNFEKFGCNILKNSTNPVRDIVPRKDRREHVLFSESRWTPVLKDVLELFIENKLDEQDFPYLTDKPSTTPSYDVGWQMDETDENTNYLIVFITGGMTYSEMRCVYEVTKAYGGWHVMLGSDQFLTPEYFLKAVSHMSQIRF